MGIAYPWVLQTSPYIYRFTHLIFYYQLAVGSTTSAYAKILDEESEDQNLKNDVH